MVRYRLKNPIVDIEVMKLNQNNIDDVCDFLAYHDWDIACRECDDGAIIVIDESDRTRIMNQGDYVVKYKASGKVTIFSKKKFEETYERVN